jgi:hypothetical protein
MTELHSNDIIHITSSREELNGHALIRSITESEITLQIPPNHEYTLTIKDGNILEIDKIVVVYISDQKRYGYAEQRGFVKDVTICITFVDDSDVCGIITDTEEDMIEVDTDQGKLYIDFKYVEAFPEGIKDIYIDSKIVIEEDEEYVLLPENMARYTLEKQLNDLMDKLMSKTQKTSPHIRQVNKIVQRFKELMMLFSNNREPLYPKKQEPYPHVKWIVPVILNKRIVYNDVYEMSEMLHKQDSVASKSFYELYKILLNDIPFINEREGVDVTTTGLTLIKQDNVVEGKIKDDETATIVKKQWIPQVVTKTYGTSEKIKIDSYVAFSDYIPYTRGFMPSTPLIEKIKYDNIIPNNSHTFHTSVATCRTGLREIISTFPAFYSVHECIQLLEPYFIYKKDLTIKDIEIIQVFLNKHLHEYHYSVSFPAYHKLNNHNENNELYKLKDSSNEEQCVAMLSQDYGKLKVALLREKIKLDYSSTLDDMKMEPKQSSAPPIVKEYKTLQELKMDNVKAAYYDSSMDTTNYEELKPNTTPKSMMQYLIFEKKMSPEQAKMYTPGFLHGQRIVVNGEYAKLGNQYYKRINHEWVLDETCYGPYPCTSNEPNCTDDCVDVTFRLKENLKFMINEYKINTYSSQISLKEEIDALKTKLTSQLAAIQHINQEIFLKYNNKKLALYSSSSIVTKSPNEPLFLYILQKPHCEKKYKELLSFINLHTRIATMGEDKNWFYCLITNVKLVPVEYKQLAILYDISIKDYNDYIDILITQDKITLDDDVNYIFKHSGYPIGPKKFATTFDDQVRSEVFDPEIIFSLPRPTHSDTPIIFKLLNDISNAIEDSQIPKYFNFIAHDMEKDPSNYTLLTIAYVITLSQLNQETILDKLRRLKLKIDISELKRVVEYVNSRYMVQQIIRSKVKREGGLKKRMIWDTFLPPLNVIYLEKTAFNPNVASMNIMYLNHEYVTKQEALPGNTCEYKHNKQISTIVSQFKPHSYKVYEKNIPFHFVPPYIDCSGKLSHPVQEEIDKYIFVHVESIHKTLVVPFIPDMNVLHIKQYIFNEENIPVQQQTLLFEDKEAADHDVALWTTFTLKIKLPSYESKLQSLLDEFNQTNVDLKTLYQSTTPIHYIKSFILLILQTIPSLILHPVMDALELPPSVVPLISRQHYGDLHLFYKEELFYKIITIYKDLDVEKVTYFDKLVILKRVSEPHDKDTIYEMYFYMLTILKLYLNDEKSADFVQLLVDTYIKIRDTIFLDNERIKKITLTYKVIESEDRNKKLNDLSTENKSLAIIFTQKNLDKESRIGREQGYSTEGYNLARTLRDVYSDRTEDAPDLGSDGNGNND